MTDRGILNRNETPMTQPTARLLKVQVQPVFVVTDENGDVHEVNVPAATVAGVDWREFGANSFDRIDLDAVAAQWAADPPEVDPEAKA